MVGEIQSRDAVQGRGRRMSKNLDKPLVAITDCWRDPLMHTELTEA